MAFYVLLESNVALTLLCSSRIRNLKMCLIAMVFNVTKLICRLNAYNLPSNSS